MNSQLNRFILDLYLVVALGVTLMLFYITFYTIFEPKHWTTILIIELDTLVALYVMMNMARIVMAFILNLLMLLLAMYLQFGYLMRLLNVSLIKFHKYSSRLASIFKFVFREHNRITYLLLLANKEVWSKLLLIYGILNIPMNVYFVAFMLNRMVMSENMPVIFLITFFQFFGLLFVLIPATYTSSQLHRVPRQCLSLQAAMKADVLSTKLKLLGFVEQLHTDNKISISVGTLAVVTKKSLLDVSKFDKFSPRHSKLNNFVCSLFSSTSPSFSLLTSCSIKIPKQTTSKEGEER